jgi:N utilization substance protein B
MSKGRRPANRTRARERALQALYQVDLASADPIDALSNAWKSEEEPPEAGSLEYSDALVRGVSAKRAEIDQMIERFSHHWRVDRMARVDRNVLRLAVWELVHQPDVPRKVVLNEAIELAKRFGTEESGAFVNGILDKLAASLPPEAEASK